MIPNLKMVVFDMSGTTVKDYNEVLDNFHAALVETGIPTDKAVINTMMGWSKIEVFEKLWYNHFSQEEKNIESGDFEAMVHQKAQHSFQVFKEMLENWYAENPIEPTDGCLDLFNFLRKKDVKIVLNTGFYRVVADKIMHKLGWKMGETFDWSITSDEVLRGRPEPFMIQRAMAHFNITEPKQVAKIGDTPSDLQEGKAAGVHSFGVTNGTHTKEALVSYKSDGLFDSLAAFQNYLAGEKD